MKQTVYVVTREGIYRHEIAGIYTTLEQAEARAKALADEEPDNWHGLCVSLAAIGEDIDDVEEVSSFRQPDQSKWRRSICRRI